MRAAIFHRIWMAVLTVIGVVLVTFVIARLLPGDPAAFFAGPAADNHAIEQLRHQMGLDRGIADQLLVYLQNIAHNDFGHSLLTGNPVSVDIVKKLPASLELAACAFLLAALVAIPTGTLAAVRRGSWIDRVVQGAMSATAALPVFFVALLILYVFYYRLRWAPAPIGRLPIFTTPPPGVTGFLLVDTLLAGKFAAWQAAAAQLILPSASLALFAVAPLARMTRSLMVETLNADFITAAQAHGLSPSKVLVTYAFRNVSLSLLNVMGMVFSFLVGATVLVEKIYGWPGIGSYAVQAVLSSDYAAVQGFVFAVAVLYIAINLVIDVVGVLLDPRARQAA